MPQSTGKARDKLAAAVGHSGQTLDKATAVVRAAAVESGDGAKQAAAAPDRTRQGGVLATHAAVQERAQGPREPYDPGLLGYPSASLGAAIVTRPGRRR